MSQHPATRRWQKAQKRIQISQEARQALNSYKARHGLRSASAAIIHAVTEQPKPTE